MGEMNKDRYDALNLVLKTAEIKLKKMHSPEDVWINGWRTGQRVVMIGLARINGKRMLCIAERSVSSCRSSIQPTIVKELSGCSLSDRVKAVKYVKLLIEEIVKVKESYISKVDEAIKELQDLMEGR